MDNPVPDTHDVMLGMSTHHPGPRATVLSVVGELDSLTSDLLAQRAADLLADRPDLVIDLSGVDFLGSSGLRVLMSTHVTAEAAHGRLHIVTGSQRAVIRAITITALDRVLNLHGDLDGAIAALPDATSR